MNTSGIFISAEHVKSLSKEQQEFLFSLIGGGATAPRNPDGVIAQMNEPVSENLEYDPHFVEFSPSQAREFYAGCKDKTRKAVEVIAKSSDRFFQLADVAQAIGVTAPELKGVWSGLTRRARSITGDADAYLVDWNKSEGVFDQSGNYIDHRGEITEMTHASFRKALGLS